MKEMLKKLPVILIAVALLLCMLPMSALAAQSGDYTYEVSNGKATITGYTGDGGDITIPSKLGGYPVTAIGDSAFGRCSSLSGVMIPSGVTSIGNNAFTYCDNLRMITIPGSMICIGDGAFSACRSLTSVTIPNGVISIGRWSFSSCWNLTSVRISGSVSSIGEEAFANSNKISNIYVDASNKKYSSQDGVLFNEEKTELVQYPIGNARSIYTIPGSVTSIGERAFTGCTRLSSVTIPGSVTTIKAQAFAGCTNLSSISIFNGVTSIMDEAFANCSKLKSITIPSSIAYIGPRAFYCYWLDRAFFRGNAPVMGSDVFYYKPDFTLYYLKGKTGFSNPWHGYRTAAYVIPAEPTSVQAASASYNSVNLTWSAVTGANGYLVYRATSRNGPYTMAALFTSGSTVTYTNAGLTVGNTYYYKIRAFTRVGGEWVYGGYSAVASARPVPAASASVKAASASYNSIKLTWGAVAGASGYVVYRSASSNGAYTLAAVISSGSTASYTNAGLTAGKTYYYKLRAYRMVGTAKVHGDYSAVVSARPIPALPAGVKAVRASATSIKLTWGTVTGTSGYVVYRATSSTGAYTLVAVLTGGTKTTYTSAGLTTGKTYYYKVRAYRTVGTTKVYSNYSAVVSAKP